MGTVVHRTQTMSTTNRGISKAIQKDGDFWRHDSLSVDEDGLVTGEAMRWEEGEVTIRATVSSYYYDDGDRVNHIPIVVVTDSDGSIMSEVTARDGSSAKTAMKRCRRTAKNVFDRVAT